jgi:DNA adenine methylase
MLEAIRPRRLRDPPGCYNLGRWGRVSVRNGNGASFELSPPDPRPFVKWAGGKSTLVAEIARRIPKDRPGALPFERYVEPFAGAGAMFFWVRRSFPLLECVLTDSNEDLINAYRALRDDVERVIAKLETHAELHSEEHFYAVRAHKPRGAAERAARFIYLNRTCYNGLYRVNRRGEFNVPFGRYDRPRIVDRENLLAVATVLAGVDVRLSDFETVLDECGERDLVYLDPPYHPLSRTSAFTSYTVNGFGAPEQTRLAHAFERAARRRAALILSNSNAPFVRELYEGLDLDPAPVLETVSVSRPINSRGSGRGAVAELLIHCHCRSGIQLPR